MFLFGRTINSSITDRISTMNHRTLLTVPVVLLVFCGYAIEHAQSELFTALVHMEGLLNLEQDLLQGLNAYIYAEKQR